MKALIVGMGFAGNLHYLAWKKLGYEVYRYDIVNGSKLKEKISSVDPDVVDFCDTPKSRMKYISDLEDLLSNRKVFVEKPPCRPCDLMLWEKYKATPMHNYLFMPFANKLEHIDISIFRCGPHRNWYADVELSGGGILVDHGYHWLYVADKIGIDITKVSGFVDSYPDFTCVLKAEGFSFYATWNSPYRSTVLNGTEVEPRSEKVLVQSFVSFFTNVEDSKLKAQSVRVMKTIRRIYNDRHKCARAALEMPTKYPFTRRD